MSSGVKVASVVKASVAKVAAVVAVAACCLVAVLRLSDASWDGVDETVVNATAREAGRYPVAPLVDPSRGDLGLFLFLVAGAAGGFVAGYHFRGLFSSSPREPSSQ